VNSDYTTGYYSMHTLAITSMQRKENPEVQN
jgi:hypothetical protein